MSFAFDCRHLYQYCSHSLNSVAYHEYDRTERPMNFVFAISEAIMEKALLIMFGLEVQLGS